MVDLDFVVRFFVAVDWVVVLAFVVDLDLDFVFDFVVDCVVVNDVLDFLADAVDRPVRRGALADRVEAVALTGSCLVRVVVVFFLLVAFLLVVFLVVVVWRLFFIVVVVAAWRAFLGAGSSAF